MDSPRLRPFVARTACFRPPAASRAPKLSAMEMAGGGDMGAGEPKGGNGGTWRAGDSQSPYGSFPGTICRAPLEV